MITSHNLLRTTYKTVRSKEHAANLVKTAYMGLSMYACQMIHTSMGGSINKSPEVLKLLVQRSNLPSLVTHQKVAHNQDAPLDRELKKPHPSLLRRERLGQSGNGLRKLRIQAGVLDLPFHEREHPKQPQVRFQLLCGHERMGDCPGADEECCIVVGWRLRARSMGVCWKLFRTSHSPVDGAVAGSQTIAARFL